MAFYYQRLKDLREDRNEVIKQQEIADNAGGAGQRSHTGTHRRILRILTAPDKQLQQQLGHTLPP